MTAIDSSSSSTHLLADPFLLGWQLAVVLRSEATPDASGWHGNRWHGNPIRRMADIDRTHPSGGTAGPQPHSGGQSRRNT